jgi:tetratricopeptide (TPR) repeat protein
MLMTCQAHRLLGDVPRAIEGYEKVLDQARGAGVNPRAVEQFEAVLTRLKGSLEPVFVEAPVPKVYSPEQLQTLLRARLTEEELAAVVNPLEGSEAMARWARELVGGATGDLAKARALFDGLTRRIDPETDHSSRTAGEVFAVWADPMESFNCQEYTKLFLVLAREVDLKAFYVHLDVDHAGRAVNHDCAIVFAEGKALLVDPAYRWFGAPHRDYVVLDDVQVVAHHHFQSTDVDSCTLASKLHPDFAWGQRRLAMSLLAADQVEAARAALQQAAEREPDHWETCRLKGILALQDRELEAAEGHLRQAVATNSRDTDSHMLLALVLAQQGELAEARDHARACLLHRPGTMNAKAARRLIAEINEKIGLGVDSVEQD